MEYTITESEILASRVVSRYRGELTTDSSIIDDANFIIDLADKIKRERVEAAMRWQREG